MQRNHATHVASNTIQLVIEKGAGKLYDKYLNQKLPAHSSEQNKSTFENNLKLHGILKPERDRIESVPLVIVSQVPIDTFAPHKIPVKKLMDGYSTISPKNTIYGKSTKYQTIIQSQKSNADNNKEAENANDSLLFEECFGDSKLARKADRPLTMQMGRGNQKNVNNLELQSKLEEVEEKRAATCHTGKRKKFVSSKEKKQSLIKLKEEAPVHLREEIEEFNRLRCWRQQRLEQQIHKEREKAKAQASARMKERRAKETFEELKTKIQGNNFMTNFESVNGEIVTNGKTKQQRTHIIQLQFNPEEERTLRNQDPKVMSVSAKKKNSFTTKLKKKLKMTNEQYTNNGERQTSSIPYMTLNYGIAMSESVIQVSASRRRPTNEVSREQFTSQIVDNRFKSYIPMVNSARTNMFATIDETSQQTGRQSLCCNPESTEKHLFQTTIQSKRDMQLSLLWKPRGQSQGKGIRISNQLVFDNQILQSKLRT